MRLHYASLLHNLVNILRRYDTRVQARMLSRAMLVRLARYRTHV
jgi:hypothetical protein